MAPVHISLLACFLPVFTSRWHREFLFSITTKAIFFFNFWNRKRKSENSSSNLGVTLIKWLFFKFSRTFHHKISPFSGLGYVAATQKSGMESFFRDSIHSCPRWYLGIRTQIAIVLKKIQWREMKTRSSKKWKKKKLLLTNENKRVRERTGDYDAGKKRM